MRAAGGVTVFAHPVRRGQGPTVADEVIAEMAAAGLTGLEVDHADHPEDARRHLRGLAADLGLLVTGSSDFHGANKTVQLGAHLTDPAQLEELCARATGVEVL